MNKRPIGKRAILTLAATLVLAFTSTSALALFKGLFNMPFQITVVKP